MDYLLYLNGFDDALLEQGFMEVEEGGQNIFLIVEMVHPQLDEGDQSGLDQGIILFEEKETLHLLQELLRTDLGEEGEVGSLGDVAEQVDREGDDLGVVY